LHKDFQGDFRGSSEYFQRAAELMDEDDDEVSGSNAPSDINDDDSSIADGTEDVDDDEPVQQRRIPPVPPLPAQFQPNGKGPQ